jgi:hypothetical protein
VAARQRNRRPFHHHVNGAHRRAMTRLCWMLKKVDHLPSPVIYRESTTGYSRIMVVSKNAIVQRNWDAQKIRFLKKNHSGAISAVGRRLCCIPSKNDQQCFTRSHLRMRNYKYLELRSHDISHRSDGRDDFQDSEKPQLGQHFSSYPEINTVNRYQNESQFFKAPL